MVTIDGPAGAGKSTAARALARRLGFHFLDTGAMYRAATLALLRHGWQDLPAAEAAAAVARLSISVDNGRVTLDGEDVTDEIRSDEVTAHTHLAADNAELRRHLSRLQRQFAARGDTVTEGRDQGTVVFPQAECKIFLTASPEERARRRQEEQQARGEAACPDEILRQINERDRRDQRRRHGGLFAAADAIEVLTDGLTLEQVVDRLEAAVLACRRQ